MLERPLGWKKPQTIFVNSMSDLFHDDVPVEFIRRAFEVMVRADWHRFQVLTKRAERLAATASDLSWPDNVWMGVSVESYRYRHRVDSLRRTPDTGPRPHWYRLGHRRRRVRPRRAPHARGMGHRPARPVRRRARAVLLQAVGRAEQEGDGS
jgi:hypothetical protein